MPVLLHIDSSPLGSASISRALSAEFVENWKKAHPDGQVITRDLNATPLTVIDAAWVGASYTPADSRSAEQKEILSLSDALLAELREADEYVIGTPMHNFTVASALRLYIDQIVRVGETFRYTDKGLVGLLENKKATFVIASGGVYGEGSAAASFNFVEPYLRTVFGFIGVKDSSFHAAGGAAQITSGAIDRDEFLKTHLEAIRAGFATV